MPRYDFKCDDGHVVEAAFKFADTPDWIPCHTDTVITEDDDLRVPCPLLAYRQIGTGAGFINWKESLPPSKRRRKGAYG